MPEPIRRVVFAFGCAAAVATGLVAFMSLASAQEYPCPPGLKSCKVIVLSPDEETTLVGPEMIFDHAVWAARVKFESMTQAWREKIRQAPAGKVAPEPVPAVPGATK